MPLNLHNDHWCLVTPVPYYDPNNVLRNGFRIADNLHLTPTPQWLSEFNSASIGDDDFSEAIEFSGFVLIQEYAGYSYLDNAPANPDKSFPTYALERFRLAAYSLWLARPTSITFNKVLLAANRGNIWRPISLLETRPIEPLPNDKTKLFTPNDMRVASNLYHKIVTVTPRSAIGISIQTSLEALSTSSWSIRFLFVWVALEALFGPSDAREITYRISTRIALFNASDGVTAQSLYRASKIGYSQRSRIVHGGYLRGRDQVLATLILEVSEAVLRKSLRRILSNDDYVSVFSGSDREKFLDELVFNQPT